MSQLLKYYLWNCPFLNNTGYYLGTGWTTGFWELIWSGGVNTGAQLGVEELDTTPKYKYSWHMKNYISVQN